MRYHPSPEAAYGAACASLVDIIRAAGADDETAHRLAEECVNTLQRDGWRYRWREPEPALRSAATPGPPPAYVTAAREQLAADLERRNAEIAAREKQTLEPAP